jgi:exonuclease SbcC
LSGGETFLASLAMALELSEQIRAKAGRVDLDCIFIDEGFGTLDAETLETVTEAVEGLKRPGRLVGIITHVGELAQRMPERLVVEKSAVGSTVRFADSMVYPVARAPSALSELEVDSGET